MRYRAAASLTALALVLAGRASAQTTVSSASTTNLQTSTAGDVTIASGASITPASGAAVTVDSNNSVSNAGTISASNVDNVTAIQALASFTSNITNSGAITFDETYAATDTNGDGIVEAPFAQGTGRNGILLQGTGVFTGTITNSGTITIKGNQSSAIASDVPIVGNVISSGAISVLGNNSYGIRLGPVSGTVAVAGTTGVSGDNSAGVVIGGDVGGAVVIHNAITTTGYTTTATPTSTSTIVPLDMGQSRSALIINGNIAGGLFLAAAPADTTDTTIDADGDGIPDASESTAALYTYGTAPALLIGAADRAITLGTVTGSTAGLLIQGTVSGNGVFAGLDANAVQIGGLGAPVTISGGIINGGGTISALTNGGVASAIHLESGVSTPSLGNSGTISATSSTTAGGTARAIAIDAGASLPVIANTGTISSATTTTGTSAAILDQSGTLTQVSSTGTISATGPAATTAAIDVRANTSGFTYTQSLASSTAAAPSLTGAILTGSGADSISASAGKISSAMSLGDGSDQLLLSGTAAFSGSALMGAGDDVVSLADTSSYSGTIDFGGGNDLLTVGSGASFSGQILGTGSNVALVSQGGAIRFTGTGTTTLGSMTLNGGSLGVIVDPATGAHTTINVAGATTIGAPTTVNTTFSSLPAGATSYTILQSGSLTGSGNLNLAVNSLPYLLNGSLVGSDASGTIAIAIAPKSAAQLGLNRSEATAYPALYSAIAGNGSLSTLFSGLATNADIQKRLRQMLPDHAGGIFALMSIGTEQVAPGSAEVPWAAAGDKRIWVHQAFYTAHQDSIYTPGYHGYGFAIAAGGDVAVSSHVRAGVTVGYVFGNVTEAPGNSAIGHQFQLGGYGIFQQGGLELSASANAGYVALSDRRNLSSTSSFSPVLLTSDSSWGGLALSAYGKASYELVFGKAYIRPQLTLSYYSLREGSHSGSGGGLAYDLQVNKRNSDELALTGEMAAGLRFGSKDPEETSFKVEMAGGRRELLQSGLGATTARFSGGNDFTLLPEDRDSSYVGSVNASVGSNFLRVVASARVEDRTGYHNVAGQIGLRGSF